MRVKVTFELDSIAEAEEVMQAVKLLKDKPYRLKGFGAPIVDHEIDNEVELEPVQVCVKQLPDGGLAVPDLARPNVNPGEPSIGKIGTATMELILANLKVGKQMPLPKYEEHLKLLWKRGLVKYDNTTKEFYV